MKQTSANLLTIESTSQTAFPGDTTGDSIVVTGSGSASKGETAQQYGLPGLICNPSAGTIGLQIKKGALSIIVGSMNYDIPLPENQGETLLFSTDSDGAVIGKHYLDNDGIHTFNDGTDYAVAYTDLETAINNFKTSIDTENTTETTTTTTALGTLSTEINSNTASLTTTISAMVTAFAALGVTITPYVLTPSVPSTVTSSEVSVDISASKVEEILIP